MELREREAVDEVNSLRRMLVPNPLLHFRIWAQDVQGLGPKPETLNPKM